MAYTLNQFIKLLSGYATLHSQVNTFQVGDPWEFAESEDVLYPALFMIVGQSRVSGRELLSDYTLIFADRIDKDSPADINAQENEVLSDMREVALDFLAMLKNPANNDNFNIVKEATLQSFTERFKDLTAGYTLDIQIKQPMLYDRCQVPNG